MVLMRSGEKHEASDAFTDTNASQLRSVLFVLAGSMYSRYAKSLKNYRKKYEWKGYAPIMEYRNIPSAAVLCSLSSILVGGL
jgi:hypothetical protein